MELWHGNSRLRTSLAALVHGMQFSDGVELDLRMSADEELVAYHDTKTADGRFPECEDSLSMPSHVCTFDEMLAEPSFTNPWLEGSRFACIELKIPHPSSGKTGWLMSGEARTEHMRKMIELVDESLEPVV